MNKLKCRAKCSKTGKWVYGYYAQYNLTKGEVRHGIIEADKPVNVVTIDLNTLGQLVTVQDGVEIYEGDLVCVSTYSDPIIWDEICLTWAISVNLKNGIDIIPIDRYCTEKIIINGNIHDQKIII